MQSIVGGWIEKLLEAKENCGEDSDCSKCPFGQIKDKCILTELQIKDGNNGWIPCSERLPDKDLWCLATFESGGIDKIQYLVTNKWGWNGEFADNKVVAWMPLPEPFKQIAEWQKGAICGPEKNPIKTMELQMMK